MAEPNCIVIRARIENEAALEALFEAIELADEIADDYPWSPAKALQENLAKVVQGMTFRQVQ